MTLLNRMASMPPTLLARVQTGEPREIGMIRRYRMLREVARLESLPRYRGTTTSLLGRSTRLVDAHTFLVLCREIMWQQIYRFQPRRSDPVILDCGANIGLATIYWKQQFPEARIVAFEPDPEIFEVLRWNCTQWGLDDVELRNEAVWIDAGRHSFWAEGSNAGRLVPHDALREAELISVPTVRLRDSLTGPIDLLKLDIEGAEVDVLLDCADALGEVDHLFVEFHSFIGRPQRLDSLLSVLREAEFRVYLQPQILLRSPFVQPLSHLGLDQTVNIFARRSWARRTASKERIDESASEPSQPCVDRHSHL